MRERKPVFLIFAVIVMALVTVLMTSASQNPKNPQPNEQAAFDESQYPIAEYDVPEPTDPRERELRRARGKSNVVVSEVEKLRIKAGDPEFLVDLPVSHAPTEPAFPVVQSDVVVVGEVAKAKAYLTHDKVSVYSEFIIQVQDVLKATAPAPVTVGSVLEAKRGGGRVRLPSGKVLLRTGKYGRNMPRVGGRYVFFLQFNEQEQIFSIVTAYGLRDGRVYPLDGDWKEFGKSAQFAAYRTLDGADEATFIQELYGKITSSSQVPPSNGRSNE